MVRSDTRQLTRSGLVLWIVEQHLVVAGALLMLAPLEDANAFLR